jgi:nucleotide-binding universal stress UspA family protein
MRILIATDGSTFSEAAVEETCKYIKPGDTEVRVIAVYEDITIVGDMYGIVPEYHHLALDAVRAQAEKHLGQAVAHLNAAFTPDQLKVESAILCGPPDREIVEEATRWNADLIVVGSHGRGFWGRMIGSVSEGVVNHAPCPVLVVRPRTAVATATA